MGGQAVLGATYEPCAWDADTSLSVADHERNLAAYAELQRIMPELPDIQNQQVWPGRAAIRATTPQHLPIYGPIFDQLNAYYLTGLGSRGLMTAPYVAKKLINLLKDFDVSILHKV